jgi:Protein of unknown function (DUF760)
MEEGGLGLYRPVCTDLLWDGDERGRADRAGLGCGRTGLTEDEEWGAKPAEFSVTEISRILYFLMIVGYFLRTLEVRFDMETAMLVPEVGSSPAPLPP